MPVIHFGWSNACCKGSLLKFILKDETSMEKLQPRLLPPCHFPAFRKASNAVWEPKKLQHGGQFLSNDVFFLWRFSPFFAGSLWPHDIYLGVDLEIEVVKTQFLLKIQHFHLGMGGGSPKIPVKLTENCWWRWERLYLAVLLKVLKVCWTWHLGTWVLGSH